jgi:AcrR family transcriptional regulator
MSSRPTGNGVTLCATSLTRRIRADAQRNLDTLLRAAAKVFARSGVDAPAREVAEAAGVGVGTLYRHFPKRSDLVAAVFRREVDACAAEAAVLAAKHKRDPVAALRAWLYRYMDFILAKRGLAPALHSGDPAFAALHDYFDEHLGPALTSLLDATTRAGRLRTDLAAHTLLHAVRVLCVPDDDGSVDHARPVVDLLIHGMRMRAKP